MAAEKQEMIHKVKSSIHRGGSRIFIGGGGGGGGAKDHLRASRHDHEERSPLRPRSRALRPCMEVLVYLMLSRAIWALCLRILIQNGLRKHTIVDQNVGGRASSAPPLDPTLYLLSVFVNLRIMFNLSSPSRWRWQTCPSLMLVETAEHKDDHQPGLHNQFLIHTMPIHDGTSLYQRRGPIYGYFWSRAIKVCGQKKRNKLTLLVEKHRRAKRLLNLVQIEFFCIRHQVQEKHSTITQEKTTARLKTIPVAKSRHLGGKTGERNVCMSISRHKEG